MPDLEYFLKLASEKLQELEQEFLAQKANETLEARNAIVKALKDTGTSLPGAIFALEIVKWELLRGQYEEFVGHAMLRKDHLPLSQATEQTEQAGNAN